MTRTIEVGGRQARANGEGFPMAEQQASNTGYWLLRAAVTVLFLIFTVMVAVTAYPNLR
jgi:hypothetical protein